MLHNFERCLEKNAGFETDFLKILYYDLEEGYHGIYRSYEYNRVCTILSGDKRVTINQGEQFVYTPSEFILLPPHSSVEMDIQQHTKAVVYEISDIVIDKIKEHVQNKFDQSIITESKDNIKQHNLKTIQPQITRINHTLTTDDPDRHYLIDLISQEMVFHLIKNNFIKNFNDYNLSDPVEYTMHYMREHIYESISLTDLAHKLNMSASGLSTKFKRTTGFSPKEYFNMIKLKKSKELLATQNVTEVCYDLGFNNISYFIDLFKRHFGETPKKYAMKLSYMNHQR